MTFPEGDPGRGDDRNSVQVLIPDPDDLYSDSELERMNRIFTYCEQTHAGTGGPPGAMPVQADVDAMLSLARESYEWAGLGGYSVEEVYNFVQRNVYPPREPQRVMTPVTSFLRQFWSRMTGDGRHCSGMMAEVIATTDTLLSVADDARQVLTPTQSHVAGSMSSLWQNPPRVTVTRNTASFRPSSVAGDLRMRGEYAERFGRGTEILDNMNSVARVAWWATVANNCFSFGSGFAGFQDSSHTWRNTLQAFNDDPTPENLVAYGVAAGSMVDDISSMLNNPPVSPYGSIPFFSAAFDGAGNVSQRLVAILGQRLTQLNHILDYGDSPMGSGAARRGAGPRTS